MPKEILNIKEVCAFLGIKPRTMYSLLKEGKLPAVKIGGQWRFSKQLLTDMFYNQAYNAKSKTEDNVSEN